MEAFNWMINQSGKGQFLKKCLEKTPMVSIHFRLVSCPEQHENQTHPDLPGRGRERHSHESALVIIKIYKIYKSLKLGFEIPDLHSHFKQKSNILP